ncbi:hypothetical protein GGR56DRAFT_30823 [Xylariaceae sp. FL0804]|nr:hypothetical protein GGR56DRAFT_30823 [Xylariaceae sp. FL0804]
MQVESVLALPQEARAISRATAGTPRDPRSSGSGSSSSSMSPGGTKQQPASSRISSNSTLHGPAQWYDGQAAGSDPCESLAAAAAAAAATATAAASAAEAFEAPPEFHGALDHALGLTAGDILTSSSSSSSLMGLPQQQQQHRGLATGGSLDPSLLLLTPQAGLGPVGNYDYCQLHEPRLPYHYYYNQQQHHMSETDRSGTGPYIARSPRPPPTGLVTDDSPQSNVGRRGKRRRRRRLDAISFETWDLWAALAAGAGGGGGGGASGCATGPAGPPLHVAQRPSAASLGRLLRLSGAFADAMGAWEDDDGGREGCHRLPEEKDGVEERGEEGEEAALVAAVYFRMLDMHELVIQLASHSLQIAVDSRERLSRDPRISRTVLGGPLTSLLQVAGTGSTVTTASDLQGCW